jgi:hypothetical protein
LVPDLSEVERIEEKTVTYDVCAFGRWVRDYLDYCGAAQRDLVQGTATEEYNISRYLNSDRRPPPRFVVRTLLFLKQRRAFEYPVQAREGLALLNVTPQEIARQVEGIIQLSDIDVFLDWLREDRHQSHHRGEDQEQGLRCHIYDFYPTIRAATRRFVGRRFVFEAIDAFLNRHPCGYLRIVAGAGLGKTAIAAALVNRRPGISYFFDAERGITRPDQCLNHICASLIETYDLSCPALPPRAGADSALMVELIEEVTRRAPLHKVLTVIDGLDVVQPVANGHNWAHLPRRLPKGAYVIVTQRPGIYPISTDEETPIETLTIRWNDPQQQADVMGYLKQELRRVSVRRSLEGASPSISDDQFVRELRRVARGNFAYLRYALEEIAGVEPGKNPLDLEDLPVGMKGYYAQLWRQITPPVGNDEYAWRAWYDLYRPIIALLAVAREPVRAAWLADHVGRDETEVRNRVLKRVLRPILIRERENGKGAWRLVHWSFALFLADKLDLEQTHRRIASYYLADPGRREAHDGYARRHLDKHLVEAGMSA